MCDDIVVSISNETAHALWRFADHNHIAYHGPMSYYPGPMFVNSFYLILARNVGRPTIYGRAAKESERNKL